MNNYPNFRNYNKQGNPLYDPYNGFIRGNLFKDTYDPYIKEEPYEIKPMNEQAKLLTDIDSLSFAMTDLNLFLDVYPDNKEAINLFNQYRNKKETLLKEYENKYGPMTVDGEPSNMYFWQWIDMPWPWDN